MITLATTKRTRPRNCSFENVDTCLDTIEITTEHGQEQVQIPALPGTIFWSVLCYMYQNPERRVFENELIRGVTQHMQATRGDKWDRLTQKEWVKTQRGSPDNGENVFIVEQKAKSVGSRIISNARNLCRIGGEHACGKRLINRGHVMRYYTDEEGDGFFVLYLKLTPENTTPSKRGRRPSSKPSQTQAVSVAL